MHDHDEGASPPRQLYPGIGAGNYGATTRVGEGNAAITRRIAGGAHEDVRADPATHYVDERDDGAGFVVVAEGHNLTTDPLRVLLAALFGGQIGYSGVQFWAVGSGDPSDNPQSPPAPSPTDARLVTEIARVPVAISYLDDLGNPVVGGVSRHIQVQAVFPQGLATGANTEFGLFGGTATAVANTGLMIDRVTHPVFNKQSNTTRRITLVFSF